MIYTIGHRENYNEFFVKYGVPPHKLGRDDPPEYSGGWVWKTIEEAQACCPSDYEVYGVKALWEINTIPGDDPAMPGMHYLTKTSELVKLSNQD